MYKKNPYIQCPEEQEKKTQKKQTEQQLNLKIL